MKRRPIHNDNYEEYFLLYVDNELTSAEREQVEAFIIDHPDLKIELQMLLDTRLDMEEMHMLGREKLYREEEPGLINQDNVEELQVLMLDNELGQEEIKALEQYHVDHEEAAKNFDWLKKTKLPEEQVLFPNKKLLYRTEQKPASIINIKWYRLAAAAAVLITAGLMWMGSENGSPAVQGTDQIAQTVPGGNDSNSGPNSSGTKFDQGATKSLNGNTPSAETNVGGSGNRDADESAAAGADGLAKADQATLSSGQAENGLAKADQVQSGSGTTGAARAAAGQSKNELAKAGQVQSGSGTTGPARAAAGQSKNGLAKESLGTPAANGVDIADNGTRRNNGKNTQQANEMKANGKTEEYAALEPVKTTGKPVEIIDKVADGYLTAPNSMGTTAAARNIKTNYASDALNNEIGEDDEEDMEPDPKQRKGLRGIVRKANRFYNKVTNPDIDRPMVKVANFEIGLSR